MSEVMEMEQRTGRRSVRAPTRFSEELEPGRKKSKVVYRLLRKSDVTKAWIGEEVYVLWPDNGTWYRAEVEDLNVKKMTADLFYGDTEEQETADLAELIEEGQIAFKEERSIGHVCNRDEIELGAKYYGRQSHEGEQKAESGPSAEEAGGSGGEEDEEEGEEAEEQADEDDAGAGADSSDPSFTSNEEAGRERKKGKRGQKRKAGNESGDESVDESDDSDEEVVLEDFEKRELLRDASDDDKPLGYRMSQEERKQKRQAKARSSDSGGVAASPKGAGTRSTAGAATERPAHKAAAPAVSDGVGGSGGGSGSGAGPGGAGGIAGAGERPRRRASAGVAAATQALAAAAGVAIAPATAPAEVDEEEAAERYAQSLLAKVITQKSVDRGSFYGGREGSGTLDKRGSGAAVGQTEEELREKVRGRFRQALEVAAGEQGEQKQGSGEGKPNPSAVASAVEDALMQLCGGMNKEYKSKCQSLWFNLKDPHNPDLRGRVLKGELPAERLVCMSATELASRELAEYRKQKEQESLKMSVLDAEAAARFSTAAALDARDRLAAPAQLVADKLLSARETSSSRSRSLSPTPRDAGRAAGPQTLLVPSTGSAVPAGAQASEARGSAGGAVPLWAGLGREDLELATVQGEGGAGSAPYQVSDAGGSHSSPADGETSELKGVPSSAQAAADDGDAYDPEMGLADEDLQRGPMPGNLVPPPPPPGSPPKSQSGAAPSTAGIDWASIKVQAMQESAAAPATVPPALGSVLPPVVVSEDSTEPKESRKRGARRTSSGGGEGYGPQSPPHDAPPESPGGEPSSPGSLSHLILPPSDPAYLGRGVWEGQFVIPGAGAFLLSADALAGSGDVAGMLGEQEVELKGRVPLDKLDQFLVNLRRSKTRTVTVAVLRLSQDATADEGAVFKDIVSQYKDRQRTGFGEAREYRGAGGAPERIEVYVVPAGDVVRRVIKAARHSMHSAGAVEAALPGGPLDIGEDQLLLLLIHKRDWRDWFNPGDIPRPLKRQRTHPSPQLPHPDGPGSLPSLPLPGAPAAPAPPASVPSDPRLLGEPGLADMLPAVPAMPASTGGPAVGPPASTSAGLPNIDWAALSAITASLGPHPGGTTAGAPAPASSASTAPPALPDLSALLGGLQQQQQQQQQQQPGPLQVNTTAPQAGPSADFPGSRPLPQPPAGRPIGPALLPPPHLSLQPGAAPASLQFDPAQLDLLLKSQEDSSGRKRKTRWESESEKAEGGPGGAPRQAGFGPMRREAPAQVPAPPQQPQQQPQPDQSAPHQFPPGQPAPQQLAVAGQPGAAPIFILPLGQPLSHMAPSHGSGPHPPSGMAPPPPGMQYQPFPSAPGQGPQGAGPPQQPQFILLPPPQEQAGHYGGAPPLGQGGYPPGVPIVLPQQGAPPLGQRGQHGPPPPHHHSGGKGPPYPGRRGGRGGRGGFNDRGRAPPGGRRGGGSDSCSYKAGDN